MEIAGQISSLQASVGGMIHGCGQPDPQKQSPSKLQNTGGRKDVDIKGIKRWDLTL